MLLGAARYLAETRNFDGTVNFIFQPAEEGGAGARVMIEEGLFERFPCDTVWGIHNAPHLPAGTIGVRPGPLMAAADQAFLTVRGKGAHAARPQDGIDPIAVGVQLYQGIQRSEEHTSEIQSLMRITYAVFCLKKKNYLKTTRTNTVYTQAKS